LPSVNLPHNWRPRPHQRKLWRYLENGGKRAIAIWHRRAGKDDVALHHTACAMHERVGTYWHMLPEGEQVRKAIWDAVNPHTGIRRIDEAFPPSIRATTRENEMFIKFKCGSTWQALGSDNYQSLVGTPPVGIVLSEWAKAHPAAWAYLAPILVENKGWSLAITTPEGRNHAHAMHQMGMQDPTWFAEALSIEDTVRLAQEAGVVPSVTLADVETQRREYHGLFGVEAGDALIEQEWFVSFAAAILGAYFGKHMSKLEKDGQLCSVDRIPGYPVNTAWDIGVDDPMAIWVFQVGPGWLHIIDYIEGSNQGFDFYCDWLAERDYVPVRMRNGEIRGNDYVPHDAKQREPGAPGGRTRIDTLITLHRNPVLVPDHKPMDRINAARRLLSNGSVWFDDERCAEGIEVLRAYKQEYDQINRVFRKTAKHDWASHGADAFGHLAVSVEYPAQKPKNDAKKSNPNAITVNDLLNKSGKGKKRDWA
jgi:phage terminase large subunit